MSIDKNSMSEQPAKKPRTHSAYAGFLWNALGATFALVTMAPVIGIGARLTYEAFTWGWHLLGFAS